MTHKANYACAPGDEPPPTAIKDWKTSVHAFGPENAAEQAAELWDRSASEYPEEQDVWVIDLSTLKRGKYVVYMRSEPVYVATRIKPTSADGVDG